MKLAKAVAASEPKSEAVKRIAWIYTAILVVLVLGQLYAFEKFIPLIESYGFSGGELTVSLIAAVIVIAEVFALPFLIRMPLSPLMRYVSAFFCAFVPAIWFVLSMFAAVNGGIENAGILGAKVSVTVMAQLCITIGIGVLAALSLNGMIGKNRN